MNVPLSNPCISELERQAVMDVLNSSSLSLGPKLPEFERGFAECVGASHAIAVNSGTSALHLCVKAAGVGSGDEVITSPFSFVASANCILFEQGTPVFVDIDPVTWNLDGGGIEAAVSQRTRAILPVHVFGRPCEIELILHVAQRHGLAVIEDACEAVGARYHGRATGTFGDTGTFAFYPNKQMTTGEGGMIVTNHAETARLCRSWRNQGRSENGAWLVHERLGYNYRLSEINCALGIAQLSRLPEILARRRIVAERYTAILSDRVPEVILPAPAGAGCELSWFVYVVRLRDEFSRPDRDRILECLRREGIGCNSYFSPIHLQPFYREMFGYGPGDFPVAEHVSERTIALPFFTDLSDGQIEHVSRTLARAVSSARPRRKPHSSIVA